MSKFFTRKLSLEIAVLVSGFLAIIFHLLLLIARSEFANWPLIIVIFLSGIPILLGIGKKLLKRDFGADILAAISIIAAFILGEYLAGILIILMLAGGQALEAFAVKKASSALRALAKRIPLIAHKKVGSKIEDIALTDIQVGDLLVLMPHEICPADGIVHIGHGHMDESYLTGEPYRQAKAPGSVVLSGAINGETSVSIEVSKKPKDSRYAQIMRVMEEAEQKRPKIRRLADQLGVIFAPISITLALAAWWYSGDPLRFLAVLVIATPCPLLIAIPVALISTISIAARLGIIIKDPAVLEKLPTCKTAIFDKTGTLTYGTPSLSKIVTAPGFIRDDVLKYVASLEQYSKHPLAKAVLLAFQKTHLNLLEAKSVQELPGKGLIGTLGNLKIAITGRQKISKNRPEILNLLPKSEIGLECIVLIDDQYAATMQFRDIARVESFNFVKHLEPFHSFKKVMLVSGDRESEVAYLAHELGIKEMLASQSPEQKLAIVRHESSKNPTLFMGDGINDAPALKAATVGIAFGEPSEVTREASGAVIMENSLTKVDELLHLSKAMRKIALQSAIGGMALSFIGMIFAALGLIPPVAGALLQQGIDALAILNALRLVWQRQVKIDLNEQWS